MCDDPRRLTLSQPSRIITLACPPLTFHPRVWQVVASLSPDALRAPPPQPPPECGLSSVSLCTARFLLYSIHPTRVSSSRPNMKFRITFAAKICDPHGCSSGDRRWVYLGTGTGTGTGAVWRTGAAHGTGTGRSVQ